MYELEIHESFDAAHQLVGHPKCGALHGHMFNVVIRVVGDKLSDDGFLVDFGEVKKIFKGYDHSGKILHETAEQMAKKFAAEVNAIIPESANASVQSVEVWETPKNCARWIDLSI